MTQISMYNTTKIKHKFGANQLDPYHAPQSHQQKSLKTNAKYFLGQPVYIDPLVKKQRDAEEKRNQERIAQSNTNSPKQSNLSTARSQNPGLKGHSQTF